MKTKLQLLIVAILFSFNANAFDKIGIIGDAVGGWDTAHEIQLTTTDGIHYSLSNFQLLAGGFKFRENQSWHDAVPVVTGQNDWGYDAALPSGWPSGNGKSALDGFVGSINNIQAVSGYWNVTFNLATHDYAFTAGVSPFATINYTGTSVGGAVKPMTTLDGIIFDIYSVNCVAGTGQIVRPATANPPFTAKNWSANTFPAGLGVQDGPLIPVTPGAYNINFKMTTGDYEFFPVVVSVIGNVLGSAWGTDFDMTTTDNVTYTLLNQSFAKDPASTDTEAHLKIRDNHAWNVNFGCSADPDGSNWPVTIPPTAPTLSQTSKNGVNGGGGNIYIPYGTYNVSFNRTTGTWTFTSVLAVKNFNAGSFKAYPNPTKGSWNITSGNDDITSVVVYDVLGKSVYTNFSAAKEVSVNATELSKGVYFAKVATANGESTLKLIKE